MLRTIAVAARLLAAVAAISLATTLATGQTRNEGPAVASSGVITSTTVVTTTLGTTSTGPTTTSTTTSTIVTLTTSTTLLNQAPSWVSSMQAAWMLDEASGNRENLQGIASRDLSNVDASDPTSSTDRMEGTRSMSVVNNGRHTTDTFAALVSPITAGCWMKGGPVNDNGFLLHNWQSNAGTFRLKRQSSGGFLFEVYDSGGTVKQAKSPDTFNSAAVWYHVVGTVTSGAAVRLLINGAQVATTPMTTSVASSVSLYLGDGSGFNGLLDECFVTGGISDASICRICSCGIRGEQCTCSGASYTSTGRNTASCGSCTLPACNAATPP